MPFDAEHGRYDAWFDRHRAAYLSELLAIRAGVPMRGRGLEIGVGTGRFATPLGVGVGLDPSAAMLRYARNRGIAAVQGVAEALPFRDAAFDYAVVVTTICFVDSAPDMMREAHRVLRPGGRLIVGFIDAASELGKRYEAARADNPFYREATFYSACEVARLVHECGFRTRLWMQTLTRDPESMSVLEPAVAGHGRGGFVVVVASRDT